MKMFTRYKVENHLYDAENQAYNEYLTNTSDTLEELLNLEDMGTRILNNETVLIETRKVVPNRVINTQRMTLMQLIRIEQCKRWWKDIL